MELHVPVLRHVAHIYDILGSPPAGRWNKDFAAACGNNRVNAHVLHQPHLSWNVRWGGLSGGGGGCCATGPRDSNTTSRTGGELAIEADMYLSISCLVTCRCS